MGLSCPFQRSHKLAKLWCITTIMHNCGSHPIWSNIAFSWVTTLGVISLALFTSCESLAVQYVKCKLVFPSAWQFLLNSLAKWLLNCVQLLFYCVEGFAHSLTASEPIQSAPAAYSKDSFLTPQLNNAPKDCHVGFAHFGPVSFDHPQGRTCRLHELLIVWPPLLWSTRGENSGAGSCALHFY